MDSLVILHCLLSIVQILYNSSAINFLVLQICLTYQSFVFHAFIVTNSQQPNELQLSFIDVNAKPKQIGCQQTWVQTMAGCKISYQWLAERESHQFNAKAK
jgi:hypothetical protein